MQCKRLHLVFLLHRCCFSLRNLRSFASACSMTFDREIFAQPRLDLCDFQARGRINRILFQRWLSFECCQQQCLRVPMLTACCFEMKHNVQLLTQKKHSGGQPLKGLLGYFGVLLPSSACQS